MPALEKDTKLVMTILFVGAISGTNVYFYSKYGFMIGFNDYADALVFGLLTIGGILVMKAVFDLALNDRIEMLLLDRRIAGYWAKKQRDEQQREKILTSLNQNNQPNYAQTPASYIQQPQEEARGVSPSFLAKLE